MTVMKVQINMRFNSDLNVSYGFEQIVDTEEEAKDFGELCCNMVDAYSEGYAGDENDARSE